MINTTVQNIAEITSIHSDSNIINESHWLASPTPLMRSTQHDKLFFQSTPPLPLTQPENNVWSNIWFSLKTRYYFIRSLLFTPVHASSWQQAYSIHLAKKHSSLAANNTSVTYQSLIPWGQCMMWSPWLSYQVVLTSCTGLILTVIQ